MTLARVSLMESLGDRARKLFIIWLCHGHSPDVHGPEILAQLQKFLLNASAAWEAATDEQRNRLDSQVFEGVWVRDEKVAKIRPEPELRPFFRI